jgi:hypothetical protein
LKCAPSRCSGVRSVSPVLRLSSGRHLRFSFAAQSCAPAQIERRFH